MPFENSKGNLLWGIYIYIYIYIYIVWWLIKNRGNFKFIISNENMADKRNCKSGFILCIEMICGNGL